MIEQDDDEEEEAKIRGKSSALADEGCRVPTWEVSARLWWPCLLPLGILVGFDPVERGGSRVPPVVSGGRGSLGRLASQIRST
jgi:hypothetical protein